MNKMVSIIVPVYNVELYLKQCVDSLLRQSYSNLQIILVDDGSSDSSGEICDNYLKLDSRIEVVHKKNGGLSDARNAGLKYVRGDYIIFVDSDDYVHERYVEELYSALKCNSADIALCNLFYIDDNNNILDKDYKIQDGIWTQKDFWHYYYDGYGVYCVVAWNKIYKTSIFSSIRYDEGKRNEDEFIIDKIITQCERIAVINSKLYYYRQRTNSIMGQSYSMRNLDAIEAVILRCTRFIDCNNDPETTNKIIFHIQRLLTDAYQKLDLKNVENKKKYVSLRKSYICIFRKRLLENKLPIKIAIKGIAFIINEKFWIGLSSLKKHRFS